MTAVVLSALLWNIASYATELGVSFTAKTAFKMVNSSIRAQLTRIGEYLLSLRLRPSGQGQGAIINDNAMDMVPSLLTGIGLIRYGGGRLEFLPGHIYLFHKEDGKLYFFTSVQDRL